MCKKLRFEFFCKWLDYFVTDNPNAVPWPEILYYLICVFLLISVTFFLYAAQSEIAWQTSLAALQPSLGQIEENLEIYRLSEEHHLVCVFTFAAAFIGIKSAYSGYEAGFYAYVGVMLLTIGIQSHAMWLIKVRSSGCVNYERSVREVLKFHVNNYYADDKFYEFVDKAVDPGTGEVIIQPLYRRRHKSSTLMASLQKSLGCCGYDNHFDYLDVSKGARGYRNGLNQTDDLILEVPSSCCTRLYAPNIYCSAELWNDTSEADLRLQIYTEGCTYRILELCERIFIESLSDYLLLCITHVVLLLLSLPLIIIQVKVFRQLAAENPFSYTFTHHEPVETLDDIEQLADQGGDSLYAHDFHRNSDFVLNDETLGFLQELKAKAKEFEEEMKLPTHVLVAKRDRQDGDDAEVDYSKLPFVTIRPEEKKKIKEYGGRWNPELNEAILKYASSVLNMDDEEADAAMKRAELMALANAYEDASDHEL